MLYSYALVIHTCRTTICIEPAFSRKSVWKIDCKAHTNSVI